MPRVLVTGGRKHLLALEDEAWLLKVFAWYESFGPEGFEIIVGDASGVDQCVRELGHRHPELPIRVYRADWKKHGKAAGPFRNLQMASYVSHDPHKACIAFPGGKGTASCVKACRKHEVPILHPQPAPMG